jgi:hypothetical protein
MLGDVHSASPDEAARALGQAGDRFQALGAVGRAAVGNGKVAAKRLRSRAS